ncbi:hypothetical protein HPB51_024041 [Rhipicephalus microplus]|uniref:GT23 domain-containing protein n=1 Tax=Rhipicephalus microplus TaxID=6941 RepID=A0A9J6EE24_RHIMP|nr:hypothetical protein HPB51_024041 [Rhipicephalus microplus]
MLFIKNRLSARAISGVLLMTCLCLGWVIIFGYSCRTFRYEVRISNSEDSPLVAFGLLSNSPRGLVMEQDVEAIRKTDHAVRKSAEKMRRLRDYVKSTIERLQATVAGQTALRPLTGPSCNGAGSHNMIVDGYPGYDSGLQFKASNAGVFIFLFLVFDTCSRSRISRSSGCMHIRRTDKKKEAGFHNVAEYMQHAEEFYSSLALKGQFVQKRVFVATDDPEVITALKSKFPEYKIISNGRSAREAFDLKARAKSTALTGLLIDIHLLAESDYLVCAFSSGFCRVAYELMQARYAETGADATPKAVSVDIEYFYAYVPFPPRRTLYYNKGVFHNELEWTAPGLPIEWTDKIMPISEAKKKIHADGFNAGRLAGSRVNRILTIFPRFKTVRTYSVVPYGAFNHSPT